MTIKQGLLILEVPDATAWERWLQTNHCQSRGVWLKIARKAAPVSTPTYPEALESAICFGWIDGQRGAHDEHFWLQRFTRRGPRSRWSEVNREKAERLIDEGRMQPAGRAEIQAAKRDGRWDRAYPAQSRATVPDDLQGALDRHPDAKAFFETLTGVRRYAFLYRLHNVRRPEARARRIAEYIELLSNRRTLI
jgi:uncharacterized protein YdeI (YjbR/CyaY-like superfamily)